jgi:hypothetical protein
MMKASLADQNIVRSRLSHRPLYRHSIVNVPLLVVGCQHNVAAVQTYQLQRDIQPSLPHLPLI